MRIWLTFWIKCLLRDYGDFTKYNEIKRLGIRAKSAFVILQREVKCFLDKLKIIY